MIYFILRTKKLFLSLAGLVLLCLYVQAPVFAANLYGCGQYGQSAYSSCPSPASTNGSSQSSSSNSTIGSASGSQSKPVGSQPTTNPSSGSTNPPISQEATTQPALNGSKSNALTWLFSIGLIVLGLVWAWLTFFKRRRHARDTASQ